MIRIVPACLLAVSLALASPLAAQMAAPSNQPASAPAGVLNREQAGAILPPSVFFRGQSATIQARNSAGVKLPDGKLILATMVDTSGYSSSLQQTYQAYLIVEVPIQFAGKTLPPGSYGFGFIANDRVTVMDVGGNEVLSAATSRDAALTRPNPLQIVADAAHPGHYRLYLGRSFVDLAPAGR